MSESSWPDNLLSQEVLDHVSANASIIAIHEIKTDSLRN